MNDSDFEKGEEDFEKMLELLGKLKLDGNNLSNKEDYLEKLLALNEDDYVDEVNYLNSAVSSLKYEYSYLKGLFFCRLAVHSFHSFDDLYETEDDAKKDYESIYTSVCDVYYQSRHKLSFYNRDIPLCFIIKYRLDKNRKTFINNTVSRLYDEYHHYYKLVSVISKMLLNILAKYLKYLFEEEKDHELIDKRFYQLSKEKQLKHIKKSLNSSVYEDDIKNSISSYANYCHFDLFEDFDEIILRQDKNDKSRQYDY
jgi:hypothetical protein